VIIITSLALGNQPVLCQIAPTDQPSIPALQTPFAAADDKPLIAAPLTRPVELINCATRPAHSWRGRLLTFITSRLLKLRNLSVDFYEPNHYPSAGAQADSESASSRLFWTEAGDGYPHRRWKSNQSSYLLPSMTATPAAEDCREQAATGFRGLPSWLRRYPPGWRKEIVPSAFCALSILPFAVQQGAIGNPARRPGQGNHPGLGGV